MKLSSCRALKAQVLGRAYRAVSTAAALQTFTVRTEGARKGKKAQVQQTPVAAVGVAPGKGKDYKLAIRVFQGHEEQVDVLMKGLTKHKAEVDLVQGVRYAPREVVVQAGGSCGHYKITAGTLGGFVEDSDHYYMLSNNHVLANSNNCFAGDPIYQPGPADIRNRFQKIGSLHKWYPLSREDRNGFDVAIAKFTDVVDSFYPWYYEGIGTIGKTPVANRFSVTRVIKRGRTTRVRKGTVSAYELDGIMIDYGSPGDPAVVTYDDQIEVIGDPPRKAFSAPGDSGSFIIDQDSMKAYALLYGGGPDAQGIDRTLGQFMPDVLNAMGVRLVQ